MTQNTFINWQTFKAELQKTPDASLQFEYAADKWVDADYHITEIKQAPITSVDCGGVMNAWTEIIEQLWEPGQAEAGRTAMPVAKALSIADLVEKKLPLNPNAIVKIEFGNSQFDTRQMYPVTFTLSGANLIVNLAPDYTQCKAIGRGDRCGSPEGEEVCCAPGTQQEPANTIQSNYSAGQSCTPGSGCC